MKRIVLFIALSLFCVLKINAQESKVQKIGLCLSGGGAKGLAHIGLLKLIDSLGIKIDYITGTSMGGVIGALYASGYTGKQIDSLARGADWDMLLNQYVPLSDINSDEKEEFGRYIAEIPVKNKQIFMTGIIEGQKLLSFLSFLTRHVSTVSDFSKLPIPYKCMAVDIITVKPVVLDHGNLALAMRATMAIPTIFKPVRIDDRLLVDGGLMVNFPVKELKEMGADIIIGSYTGGRLQTEKEMNTINKMLVQTSTFYSISESHNSSEACAVFNNLNDSTKGFKPGDFIKSKMIMQAGMDKAYKVLPKLVELANAQKASGVTYKKETLQRSERKLFINSIRVDTSDYQMERSLRREFNFREGDSVCFADIEKGIRRIYGSRNFFKVWYELTQSANGGYHLTVKTESDIKFRIKGAVHFDTELGTGFLLNVTARNWLGKRSRLLGTIDLAQAPKYRIHYRKYFRDLNLSYNVNFLRVRAVQPFEFNSAGVANRDYSILYRSFSTGFNYNFGIPSSLYVGLIGEVHDYKPKYPDGDVPVSSGVSIQHIGDIAIGFNTQYRFNTMDRVVFPKKGIDLFVEDKLILLASEDIAFNYVSSDSVGQPVVMSTKKMRIADPYNKLFFRVTGLVPLHKRISLLTALQCGLIYQQALPGQRSDSVGAASIPYSDNYYLGGAEFRSRPNQIPFQGLKEGQLDNNVAQAAFQLGVQMEVYPKFFVTPTINYCYSSSSPQLFFSSLKKINVNDLTGTTNDSHRDFINTYTYGVNFGYRTFIGPINVTITRIPLFRNWAVYFSVGYKF